MAISLAKLRSYSSTVHRSYMSLSQADNEGKITAFLSHSHKDRDLAKKVENWLEEYGVDIYIDWEDDEMPPVPTRQTAERIQEKIEDCDWFFYLATKNSSESKWCPWEIGYADKTKTKERLLIIPTTDEDGTESGNEYLQLYQRIDTNTQTGKIEIFQPGYFYTGQSLDAVLG